MICCLLAAGRVVRFPDFTLTFLFIRVPPFISIFQTPAAYWTNKKKREQHPSVSYRLVFASRKPMSFSLNGISPYKNKKPVSSQPCGTVILLTFIQTKQSVQCRYLLFPKRQRTNNIYKKMIAYWGGFVKVPAGAMPSA